MGRWSKQEGSPSESYAGYQGTSLMAAVTRLQSSFHQITYNLGQLNSLVTVIWTDILAMNK